MRRTLRLFNATPVAPYQKTGITGITTHPLPRATLIATYNQTLELLASLPATSVYRTSTENLTKSRLAVIESVKPFGYDEYHNEIDAIRKKYGLTDDSIVQKGMSAASLRAALELCRQEAHPENDITEMNHIEDEETLLEDELRFAIFGGLEDGSITAEKIKQYEGLMQIPEEPALTPNQVANIENIIGAGLIEEVIIAAQREFQLVKTMKEYQPWEDLEVPAPEGQWVAFERKAE